VFWPESENLPYLGMGYTTPAGGVPGEKSRPSGSARPSTGLRCSQTRDSRSPVRLHTIRSQFRSADRPSAGSVRGLRQHTAAAHELQQLTSSPAASLLALLLIGSRARRRGTKLTRQWCGAAAWSARTAGGAARVTATAARRCRRCRRCCRAAHGPTPGWAPTGTGTKLPPLHVSSKDQACGAAETSSKLQAGRPLKQVRSRCLCRFRFHLGNGAGAGLQIISKQLQLGLQTNKARSGVCTWSRGTWRGRHRR
jgi:hypothetical protein